MGFPVRCQMAVRCPEGPTTCLRPAGHEGPCMDQIDVQRDQTLKLKLKLQEIEKLVDEIKEVLR